MFSVKYSFLLVKLTTITQEQSIYFILTLNVWYPTYFHEHMVLSNVKQYTYTYTWCQWSDMWCKWSDTWCQWSDKLCQWSDTLCQWSDTLCQSSDTLCQSSDTLCQSSDTLCQWSDTLCQSSDTLYQWSDILCQMSFSLLQFIEEITLWSWWIWGSPVLLEQSKWTEMWHIHV